jgi:hypothetical protein
MYNSDEQQDGKAVPMCLGLTSTLLLVHDPISMWVVKQSCCAVLCSWCAVVWCSQHQQLLRLGAGASSFSIHSQQVCSARLQRCSAG